MERSVARLVQTIQVGAAVVPAAARFYVRIHKVGGLGSRKFGFLRGLPAFEIGAKYEKLSAYLDYTNALFLNDSAEMPHRKASESSGIGDVQERPLRRNVFGRLHRAPPFRREHVHPTCQSVCGGN